MKLMVTGSLGHISKPLTQELVEKGHQVTVISSHREREKEIQAIGAKAAFGSVEDVDFLASTFRGADAVYCMTLPKFAEQDQIGYYRNLAVIYAKAATLSAVNRLVYKHVLGNVKIEAFAKELAAVYKSGLK